MEDACASLERSQVAMAILLIMSGDVEQNPGPIGQEDLRTVSKYLSSLSESDLRVLGMALGLYQSTLRGYGNVQLADFRYSLLGDWVNEKDDVNKNGGATWISLVTALRDDEVRQNGIAEKIKAEQMGGGLEEHTDSKGDSELLPPAAKKPKLEEMGQTERADKIEAEQMGGGEEEQVGNTPVTPPQTVTCFTDHLRALYTRAQPTERNKWPPSPSNKYINLAAIRREKVSREELKKFTIASLHGNIDDITETKAPIKMPELLKSEPGEALECVLVEGAPGVGKTTMAWEICNQWAKRELFQQYSIVILLTLRSQIVQKAKSIKDLISVYDDEDCEEIARYLKRTDGKDTLIILEGLDELPKDLLTPSSIFTSLLSGEKLSNTTILITSRPSATVKLWKNWKLRMSRHIEVLGFTEQNINDYVASVMSPEEYPAFNDYLSLNTFIKLMMYIPIHAVIVIETYRYCLKSSRLLPTSVTELYTYLVQTILLRHLDTHPDYKDKEISINTFKDLPPPVYSQFERLMEMALEGVLNQELIFPNQCTQIEHLGFMDTVTESIPHKRLVTYSYNFLHASVQEYLAAFSVSLKTTKEQEQLLQIMCSESHLRNMGRFLAGITKFKNMDKATVKAIVEKDCSKQKTSDGGTELCLSSYTLQLLRESGDWNIISGYSSYYWQLTDYNPLLDFSNLGHCIANSSYKWTLRLGTNLLYMLTTEGIDMLVRTLKEYSNPTCTYSIENIMCCYDTPQCVECLLMELPQNALHQIQILELLGSYENVAPPLPVGVIELVLSMISRLYQLVLTYGAVTTSGVTAIGTALRRNSTLKYLDMHANDITDSGATAIATALHNNSTLTHLYMSGNAITDNGATAIAEMLEHNNTLQEVDLMGNEFSSVGREALKKVNEKKKNLELDY